MRIISGKARGRKLFAPPGRSQDIRPTSDRAREALFNILGNSVVGARVLDLYGGTGALGLEAISRGAAALVLVDFHKTSLDLIKKNIALCTDGDDQVTLIRHDLRKGLPPVLTRNQTSCFNLIFLDPPYSQGLCLQTLQHIDNSHLLSPGGYVIAEERAKTQLPESFHTFELRDRRTYGDTGFWLYHHTEKESGHPPLL